MSLKRLVYKRNQAVKISIDVTPKFPEVIPSKFHLSRECSNSPYGEAFIKSSQRIVNRFGKTSVAGGRCHCFHWAIVMHRATDHKNARLELFKGVTLWLITRQITMITMAPVPHQGMALCPHLIGQYCHAIGLLLANAKRSQFFWVRPNCPMYNRDKNYAFHSNYSWKS